MIRLSKTSDASQIFYLLNSPLTLNWTRQYVDSTIVEELSSKGQFIVLDRDGCLQEVVEVSSESGVSRYASYSNYHPSQVFLALLLTQGLVGRLSVLTHYPAGQQVVDGERGDGALYCTDLLTDEWVFPTTQISHKLFSQNEEKLLQDSIENLRQSRWELVDALVANHLRCTIMKRELVRYDH